MLAETGAAIVDRRRARSPGLGGGAVDADPRRVGPRRRRDPATRADARARGGRSRRPRRGSAPRSRALLATDPAEQRSTPLEIVRSAYREPTEILVAAGVPPVVRDPFDERA